MSDFTGKVCPFCKTEFQPDDDIVVCSACDMPHHKDCWIENRGCSTFGCTGTIKAPEGGVTSVTATTIAYDAPPATAGFCTKCGKPLVAGSAFCTHCGAPRNGAAQPVRPAQPVAPVQPAQPRYTPPAPVAPPQPAYQQPTYQQNTYQQNTYQQQNAYQGYNAYNQNANIDPDVMALVGPKADYYANQFQTMKLQNKQTSWNWAAFLVTPYWMIYRKMYLYGAGTLLVAFILGQLGTFGSLLALAGYVLAGIFGNNIYRKHLETQAAQAKSMTEPYKSQFIQTNGGVNTTATTLTVIGYILLNAIILSL